MENKEQIFLKNYPLLFIAYDFHNDDLIEEYLNDSLYMLFYTIQMCVDYRKWLDSHYKMFEDSVVEIYPYNPDYFDTSTVKSILFSVIMRHIEKKYKNIISAVNRVMQTYTHVTDMLITPAEFEFFVNERISLYFMIGEWYHKIPIIKSMHKYFLEDSDIKKNVVQNIQSQGRIGIQPVLMIFTDSAEIRHEEKVEFWYNAIRIYIDKIRSGEIKGKKEKDYYWLIFSLGVIDMVVLEEINNSFDKIEDDFVRDMVQFIQQRERAAKLAIKEQLEAKKKGMTVEELRKRKKEKSKEPTILEKAIAGIGKFLYKDLGYKMHPISKFLFKGVDFIADWAIIKMIEKSKDVDMLDRIIRLREAVGGDTSRLRKLRDKLRTRQSVYNIWGGSYTRNDLRDKYAKIVSGDENKKYEDLTPEMKRIVDMRINMDVDLQKMAKLVAKNGNKQIQAAQQTSKQATTVTGNKQKSTGQQKQKLQKPKRQKPQKQSQNQGKTVSKKQP